MSFVPVISTHFPQQLAGGAAGYRMAAKVSNRDNLTEVHMQRSWQLFLPGSLLALQPWPLQQSSEEHVMVHLDRTMRFRYSNPNLAVVVSVSPGV